MGLFDFLHTKKPVAPLVQLEVSMSAPQERKPAADKRKAECPSCHQALKKVPGAKTKCPHCGEPLKLFWN